MSPVAGWRIVWVIGRRELIRFVRQPARIAAAIGTPCLLWLFLASGFAEALRPEPLGQVSYAAFLLPGMMTLITVFAAIFSSISIIEDRNDGWLQSVLVSPAPRWAFAFGKLCGGAVIAWVQAALLLPVLPLLDLRPGLDAVAIMLGALMLTSIGMTAMGLSIAWWHETTGGFHAVMNLLFFPLWLLSGAFFPAAGATSWLAALMAINPLSWCTQAMRGPLLGEPWALSFGLAGGFAAAMCAVAVSVVAYPRRRLG